MKKLLILFIVLTSFIAHSQDYGYLVKTEVLGFYHANRGSLNINSGTGAISSVNLRAWPNNVGSVRYTFITIQNDFTSISINFEASAIAMVGYPNCSSSDSFNTTKDNFNRDTNIHFNGCNFDITVYPIHMVYPINILEPEVLNNELCLTDVVTLQNGYNWEYKLPGMDWEKFPTHLDNKSFTTFLLSDLLGQTTANQVKFKSGYNKESGIEKYANILNYEIISCSPKLLDFDTTDTKCSYLKDGSFSMKLDRNLESGEELVVTLYTESIANSGNFDQIPNGGQQNEEFLTPNGDDITYSYHWPNKLESGNYKVKYQSHKIGEPNLDWASIVHSPQFTIRSPDPVTFSVPLQTINNVNCFEGNDGSFIITAKGGGGGYKYFLNNDAVVFFNNTNKGTDALPISQTIGNLKASSNTIKLQDANGCIEQE